MWGSRYDCQDGTYFLAIVGRIDTSTRLVYPK